MFQASLVTPKTWKQIVDAIATLLTEATFRVTSEGISLSQYDSARAARIDLFIPSDVFQDYRCEGNHTICIGVDELVKVSKRIAADDTLSFNLDTTLMRLEITMRGLARRTFRLHLLTPPETTESPLTESFDVRAEMSAGALKQAVKDIGVVSDYMIISAGGGTIVFSGSGDSGEVESELKVGDDSLLYSLQAVPSTSMYALSYLSEITKAIGSERLVLMMNSGRPAMFQFDIAERGRIKFYLAPRKQRT